MAKQDKNKDNLELYKQFLSNRNIETASIESIPTIDALAKEGLALLEAEEKLSKKTIKDAAKKSEDIKNPYVKAKMQLLAAMPSWKQELLHKMAKEKAAGTWKYHDGNERTYNEFCHEIVKRGDSLSSGIK